MSDQRSYGIMAPGASRLKRNDRESLYPAKRSHTAPPPPPPPPPQPQKLPRDVSTTMKTSKASKGAEVNSSNKLLAGFMAYEFLSKGTLLGQRFDGAPPETAARGKSRTESESEPVKTSKEKETYKEITSLVMMNNDGGVHIPGIVNPTQLARWIQM